MHRNAGKLAQKTILITGGSRGIGKSIALKAARDKANVVILAKTTDPHPKLPGTIYTAAEEVESAGGKCLAVKVDVRDESQIKSAVDQAVDRFGGIDILVNNASAISLTGTLGTDMKRYDLMNHVNARGTFLTSKLCIPHLKKSKNPHIVNMSPPLSLSPIWFQHNVAYALAKMGMSFCVLGMSEEFKTDGIAVNALWPRTAIWTAAMDMLAGDANAKFCRTAEICADAFYIIATQNSRQFTGNFCVDEYLLREHGVTDFAHYAVEKGHKLVLDGFIDEAPRDDVISSHHLSPSAPDHGPAAATSHQFVPQHASPASIFGEVEHMLKEHSDLAPTGVYVFHIDDDIWYIDGEKGEVGKGEPTMPTTVRLTMTARDFVDVFTGVEVPVMAFMSGKIKVKGNMRAAVKLDKLFSKYQNFKSSKTP